VYYSRILQFNNNNNSSISKAPNLLFNYNSKAHKAEAVFQKIVQCEVYSYEHLQYTNLNLAISRLTRRMAQQIMNTVRPMGTTHLPGTHGTKMPEDESLHGAAHSPQMHYLLWLAVVVTLLLYLGLYFIKYQVKNYTIVGRIFSILKQTAEEN
jgi:hypothetical protein